MIMNCGNAIGKLHGEVREISLIRRPSILHSTQPMAIGILISLETQLFQGHGAF